jgi:hypothetical protein
LKRFAMVLALVPVLATSTFALEKKAYQMKEDFGTEPLYDCALQYYYYVPCPTYSWFWAFSGWSPGDIIGMCFNIGDEATGGWGVCDPYVCHEIGQIRVLDFSGYGTVYPGLFTVQFDAYCAPEACCGPYAPVVHLWSSGPLETHYAWNYFDVHPPLPLTTCWASDNFGFVLTATMTGSEGGYPAWGFDNISTALETGCLMHDVGCLPVVHPRGACGGIDPKVHTGYIGTFPFEYWPPAEFCDGRDTTPGCSQFGSVELAWRVYMFCSGPDATKPSTWGNLKSMYE